MGGGKIGNAGGKGGKGGPKGAGGKGTFGKGGKGCKGGFPPKAEWKTLNPDPALIRNAQWMHWHGYPQQLNATWEQPVAGWDGPEWMLVPGARLASLRPVQKP